MATNSLGVEVLCCADAWMKSQIDGILENTYPLHGRHTRPQKALVVGDGLGPHERHPDDVVYAALVPRGALSRHISSILPPPFGSGVSFPRPRHSHVLALRVNHAAVVEAVGIWKNPRTSLCRQDVWEGGEHNTHPEVRIFPTRNATGAGSTAFACVPVEIARWMPPIQEVVKKAPVAIVVVRQVTGTTPFPPDLRAVFERARREGTAVGVICIRPHGVERAEMPLELSRLVRTGEVFAVEIEAGSSPPHPDAAEIAASIRALAHGDAMALLEHELAMGVPDDVVVLKEEGSNGCEEVEEPTREGGEDVAEQKEEESSPVDLREEDETEHEEESLLSEIESVLNHQNYN